MVKKNEMCPSDAIDSYLQLALQHIQAQAWLQAEQACTAALALDPQHAEAHHLAGHVAGQQGQVDIALAHLVRAIEINPRHAQYRYNYAVSLGLQGREHQAALQYQVCLRLEPNHRDALWNYGEMLRLGEHFELAAQLLERFAAAGGDYRALHHRLGVIYSALGQDEVANTHFIKELNAPADQVDALTHWEYSLFLLSRERFEGGFAQYRYRFASHGRNSVYCHAFPFETWQGQFKRNSTLLLHGEQGLGDEMMFASVVPEVLSMAKATKSRVILAVKPPLVRLFRLSFPGAVVVPHRVGGPVADLTELGGVDWQLAMGDLPSLFRSKLKDFQAAAHQHYLLSDSARKQWYAQQIEALSVASHVRQGDAELVDLRRKLKVGVMWGSNPAFVNAKFATWSQQRSIAVQMFEQLAFLCPDVQFISLQNPERGYEAALAPALDMVDLSHLQTDFLETACLIANLDLVISVDTSVSHLAGAMGKETWVPLIHRSDWRHGHKRKTSYWYAYTRYFQQEKSGDWAPVMAAIAQALANRVEKHKAVQYIHGQGKVIEADPPLVPSVDEPLAQAVALLGKREFDKAKPFFEKALVAAPHSQNVRWEYAMQLLTQGEWGRGWDFFEARHPVFGAKGLNMCPLPWPQWQGQSLRGKTIVVHGEQGVGDEIMYASMLPNLLAKGAKVVLACVPALVEVFRFSFPDIQVVPHRRGSSQNWEIALPTWTHTKVIGEVDYQIPIASLGQFVRRKDSRFPRTAYLHADPVRVAAMTRNLNAVAKQNLQVPKRIPFRIGLAWCGSLGDDYARARSMPLGQMRALIDIGKSRNWQFVSLQSRQYAKQVFEEPDFQLLDMSDYTDDFADLAALMVDLDLIITVDTSYGHLAAALGLTTWRLVTHTCDWRWGWGRNDSVWYPNDRLFRQPKDGDWGAVIDQVAAELKQMTGRYPL